jgi:hypothetical protein
VYLFGYLGKLINPLQNLSGMSSFGDAASMSEMGGFLNLRNILFNLHSLIQLFASAIFFVSGVYIYSRKEVN